MDNDRKCGFCRRHVSDGTGQQLVVGDRIVVFCAADWPRACATPTEQIAKILGLVAAAIILIVPSALLRVIA